MTENPAKTYTFLSPAISTLCDCGGRSPAQSPRIGLISCAVPQLWSPASCRPVSCCVSSRLIRANMIWPSPFANPAPTSTDEARFDSSTQSCKAIGNFNRKPARCGMGHSRNINPLRCSRFLPKPRLRAGVCHFLRPVLISESTPRYHGAYKALTYIQYNCAQAT